MLVSVIVPTYNGAHKLPGILDALLKQTIRDFELIVVIDGSTDNTMKVLQEYKDLFPAFQIIEQKNGGRSVVRNRGAKESTGSLLIFFDDDMLPEPDCLERHITHHQQLANSILTGAQIDIQQNKSTEVQKFKIYLSKKWGAAFPQKQPLAKTNIFANASNLSMLKTTFNMVGGFDERLTDAEDFEFAVRAYKKGLLLFVDESIIAWHNDPVTCRSYINRQRSYSKAHLKLRELNPWMIEEGFLKSKYKPSGMRKYIFEFFASSFWVSVIDKEYLSAMPEKIKYKLYDWIITANGSFFPDKVSL